MTGTTHLSTDEQQSGEAADAVKKLHDELRQRFTMISAAEERLSEVLLNAHATTVEGQAKLNDIQKKIVDAVNNPTVDVNTAAGEKSFLIFLRNQVSAINDLLAWGNLSAEEQSKAAQALVALYAADTSSTGQTDDSDTPNQPAVPAPDPGVTDLGLGPAPGMPDQSLSDVFGPMGIPMGSPTGTPTGTDPLSSLASMLPGALGGLGGGGLGGGGLSGLAGAASPLAGLPSQLGGPGSSDRHSDTPEKPRDDKEDPAEADATPPGQPPPPVAPPASASLTVTLPDGSTATARNPQTAQAVRDYLNGGTVDAAYRQNGITLPPPGTPVTNPVGPGRLTCGDIAVFTDHCEPVLSSVKGYLAGQVVPLSSVTSSPDFLGFIDPTAASSSSVETGPAPAVPTVPQRLVPAAPAGGVPVPTVSTNVYASGVYAHN